MVIAGCSQPDLVGKPTPVFDGQLTPYLTATPSPTADAGASDQKDLPKPTDIPAPTPTPFVYEVVENDTLTGIAFRHSVTLENLIAANPGLDPNFLTIGLTLTIPIEGVISAALPTPTPVPVSMQKPICYDSADGGLQCFVAVKNDQTFDIENLVVLISLRSSENEKTQSQTAISPLNIIPAGQKAAVSATFAPPFPPDYQVQANLLSVIPIAPDDQRYLQTKLQNGEINIFPQGDRAKVTGSLELIADQPDAKTIWVSATAYDAQNQIVGIRKWIADTILVSGSQISFDLVVYSFGLPIEYVEVLTEARP